MARKRYSGVVVSDKMNKTVVVAITRLYQHPRYMRTVKQVTKFKAHDEDNVCHIGDNVTIVESRPLSREKRWTVLSVNGRDINEMVGEQK
jgi:small subunit ribosomal protein S17